MAGSGADKSEKATAKRENEAHQKGQVAKSADLNGAVVLIAGLLGISLFAPHVIGVMESTLRDGLTSMPRPQELMSGAGLGHLFSLTARSVAVRRRPDRRRLHGRRHRRERRPGRHQAGHEGADARPEAARPDERREEPASARARSSRRSSRSRRSASSA